jgi:hypothetical protein
MTSNSDSGIMNLHYFIIASSLLITSCSSGCENEVSERVLAPAGGAIAVVFARNCGATTGHNIQVSIAFSRTPKGPGNIFIADGNGKTINRQAARVRWLSPRDLEIFHDPQLRVFKAKTMERGIRIHYRKAI